MTLFLPFNLFSPAPIAGELFSLVIYFSDGYLQLDEGEEKEEEEEMKSNEERAKAQRFFKLAALLPMDLQMVLCNRVFHLSSFIIRRNHSEKGFKKFAK